MIGMERKKDEPGRERDRGREGERQWGERERKRHTEGERERETHTEGERERLGGRGKEEDGGGGRGAVAV